MSALSIIIDVVLILISIVLIVAVLMQQGQRQGLGAIGGGAETFFGKNKANSAEGKLKLLTKIAAAVFIVLAIVATIITSRLVGADTSSAADTTDVTVEATEEPAEGDAADDTTEAEATEEPAFYSTDGVHPTPDGACYIGEAYLGAIAPLIDALMEQED